MVMKDAKKLLNNKLVFYAVAALAVVNVAGYKLPVHILV